MQAFFGTHYSRAMNPNLVPEVRTDKNGVPTTRWVKPFASDSDKGTAIPAPAGISFAQKPSAALISSAAAAYVAEIESDMVGDDEYIEQAQETALNDLAIYPESVLAEISRESSNPFLKYWGLKLLMEDSNTGDETDLLLDYLHLIEKLADHDYEEPEDAVRLVVSLSKNYEGLTPIPLNNVYPERRKQQLEALTLAFIWLETHVADEKMPYETFKSVSIDGHNDLDVIADEKFSRFVIDNPEHASIIVDFVKERKNLDIDAMREIISSDSPALSSGII